MIALMIKRPQLKIGGAAAGLFAGKPAPTGGFGVCKIGLHH
ncbi:hypothetical protein [Pseudomonas sp. R37(2017)]|nr:hypothetical protein [Pseudomonas sp. R37(2017)]